MPTNGCGQYPCNQTIHEKSGTPPLKIRIGYAKTNARGHGPGNDEKNDGGSRCHKRGTDREQDVGEDDQDFCQYQQLAIIAKKNGSGI